MRQRQALGKSYLREHACFAEPHETLIDPVAGLGQIGLAGWDIADKAIAECQKLIAERENQALPSKGSLDVIADGKRDIDDVSPIARLALSPLLIVPVTKYFGMLPILFSIGLTRAKSDDLLDWSSHLFHRDPEDITQIKVFLNLVDVDGDTRPFHALPAGLSQIVAKKLDYSVGRLTDQKVHELVGPGKEFVALGPIGTATFCDTNRCFHFGGRPGKRDRYLLVIQYVLPTCTWFPQRQGDGERRNLLPKLTTDGRSKYKNALLGATLTH